jgi:hypothetical protein
MKWEKRKKKKRREKKGGQKGRSRQREGGRYSVD